jgi:O-antigen ligase
MINPMTDQLQFFIFAQRRLIQVVQPWLRHLVVFGVLLVSVAIPLKLSTQRSILLVVLLVGIGSIILFVRSPQLGIVTLVATGLLVPTPHLPGGFNAAVLQLALLVALWVLALIVRKHDAQTVHSRTMRPLFALLGISILAFIVGQLPWFRLAEHAPLDAQIGGLLIFVLAVGAFLLVANQMQDLWWLECMTWVLIILGGLFVAGWVTPLGAITSKTFQIGATSNAIFWTWLVAMSLSQALFNDLLAWRWRILAGGIFVVSMYVAFVLQYDWKSAWLPPLAAIAAMVIARWLRFGLVMAVSGYVPFQILSSRAIESDEYSYSTRLDAWVIVLNMLKTNPILGFGPANYYWYTPLFRIRGYAVRFNSHNQYLDILAQTGILGLLCVVWFFGEIGWLGWQLRKRAPRGFARAYVYGALGGLVGTVVSGMLVDWFLPFAYNIGLNGFRSSMFAWLFLGGLVSIEQIIRRETQAEA